MKPVADSNTLDLSREQMVEMTHAVVERLTDHIDNIRSGRMPPSYIYDSLDVSKHTDGLSASAKLRCREPPQGPAKLESLLAELFDEVLQNGTIHTHGGYLAHVPSAGLFASALGEFVSRALNRFVGVWAAAPGLVEIECNIVRWFCSIVEFPPTAFGYLTTSGSLANWMGLICARESLREAPLDKCMVYASAQAHFSIEKAARLIGLSAEQICSCEVGPDYRVDTQRLFARIDHDRRNGRFPLCVVAMAGTTNTGAVDDLEVIAQECRARGIWLHIDACFGGFFTLVPRNKAALSGLKYADSIALDAHKSLFLPHGNSALLVRDRKALRRAFNTPIASYMPGLHDCEEFIDFCNYGPELSRDTRALSVWFPLKLYGLATFAQALEELLNWGEDLERRLRCLPNIDLIRKHPMHIPVITFRARDDARGVRTRLLCEQICKLGNVYVTTTELPEVGVVIRACPLSFRTTIAVADALLQDISLCMATSHV